MSWPRTEQLPSSTPNDRFMQKKLNEHLESASLNIMRPSTMFPENPSEFMLNVILLHAVKDSIASLHDETIARMVNMFVLRNLLRPLSNDKPAPVNSWSMSAPNTMPFGMGVSYVGLLDPVEIYRNWQRKKRALRTKMVLMTLFGNTTRPLTKHETDSIKRSIEWKRNVPVSTIANPVQISTLLKNDTSRNIFLKGLNGSGPAMTIASLFTKGRGSYVCVLNDQEEAGYFYHDLMQLTASNEVYFFPSAYRRAIKYGHVDPANEILRTEVLSRLQDPDASFVIVTYPDALAERVVAREVLKENTLKISVGEKLDNMFVSDVLDEYGFEQVDYVYEPGQYALRGSILDVFSFSYEFPYRIDFFGDEVETIRTFDVETQLSKEKLDSIYIVPEMSKNAKDSTSLLGSLPPNTFIAARDLAWCKERIGSVWNDDPVVADEESFADIDQMRKKLVQAEDFLREVLDFRRIHFGVRPMGTADATIHFSTQTQPIYHKNFDRVSESFHKYLDEGYALYILSDQEKQANRIRMIFEDRGDNIPFTAVNRTIHEGFADDTLRICFFTDHQLFDCFHKFNL